MPSLRWLDEGDTDADWCDAAQSMSAGLLLLTAGIYCWVGVGYYKAGRTGMCLAFLAYAVANIGFAWDARRI